MKQNEKQAIIDYVYNFSFEGELWSSKTAIEMIPKFADGLIKILSELRKPSEDIKQTIEAFANSQYNKDAILICANSLQESIESYEDGKRDGIIIGAEFALQLSENRGQVDEDLVKKITDILLKNHHGAGFTIPDFEVTAFKIAALIPSSLSGENSDELLDALKNIANAPLPFNEFEYGVFVYEARRIACDAISNYEKQSKNEKDINEKDI